MWHFRSFAQRKYVTLTLDKRAALSLLHVALPKSWVDITEDVLLANGWGVPAIWYGSIIYWLYANKPYVKRQVKTPQV